jgi:hypothetical protein
MPEEAIVLPHKEEMFFRRRIDGHLWHCCLNCSAWPIEDYDEEDRQPSGSKLCIECAQRIETNRCQEHTSLPRNASENGSHILQRILTHRTC